MNKTKKIFLLAIAMTVALVIPLVANENSFDINPSTGNWNREDIWYAAPRYAQHIAITPDRLIDSS